MKKLVDVATPSDLSHFSWEELEELAREIRSTIIDVMAVNGGHLASNLGVVELTIALHKLFHSPREPLIFDVGHQSYPHKLLTGRQERFATIRRWRGLCGFTHPKESPHDHFHAGHAGTALSLALGVAKSRDLEGRQEHVCAILGDASLTCGLTLEALNNIPRDLGRFLIVLNDNKMSISDNVGAVTRILSRLINNPTSNKLYHDIEALIAKIPGCGALLAKQGHKVAESLKNLVSTAPFFEQFGLSYVGPIDGHDLRKLCDVFAALRDQPRPVIVHVMTVKGKGMAPASDNPIRYHGCRPFDKATGQFHASSSAASTFPQIFGRHLLKMAERDPTLTVVTPAMPAGSCLDALMRRFPERCLDVGIAEGHAITFCGGLARDGKRRVVASIYATFLHRALDNLFHDVCLQELPVLFAIDRAGLAAGDGATHHGIYDIGFLNAMPNMVICQPRDGTVLKELMESAFDWQRPTALRYPNLPTEESQEAGPGVSQGANGGGSLRKRALGEGELLVHGEQIALVALGHMCQIALEVRARLALHGIAATVVDPIFLKPLDAALFDGLLETHTTFVTIEEHAQAAGLASIFNSFIAQRGARIQLLNFGIGDLYLEQGSHGELLQAAGLTPDLIAARILREFVWRSSQRAEPTPEGSKVSQHAERSP